MRKRHLCEAWDFGEDVESPAEHMKLRSTLATAIAARIRSQGFTQTEAASHLGVSQPRISDLMRGKIHMFTLDALVKIAVAAGLSVEVRLAAMPTLVSAS